MKTNRRNFIKASSTTLATFALAPNVLSQNKSTASTSQRRILPLNHNWLYSEKNLPGGTATRFNDAGFTRVTIPHTNKMLPWHGFDDKDYQFVSLYRRHFVMPPGVRGRKVFIDFGGVMTAATVYLNGKKLGEEYRGGYTPFSFELTPHLNWTGDNVLAVQVDSTERKDIPPFGGDIDYLTFGGIYRDVSLRVVAPTFIENVFARPVDVLKDSKRAEVRCYLGGEKSSNAKRAVTISIKDGPRIIAFKTADIPAGAMEHEVTLDKLERFELWDVNNPKLYNVKFPCRKKVTE